MSSCRKFQMVVLLVSILASLNHSCHARRHTFSPFVLYRNHSFSGQWHLRAESYKTRANYVQSFSRLRLPSINQSCHKYTSEHTDKHVRHPSPVLRQDSRGAHAEDFTVLWTRGQPCFFFVHWWHCFRKVTSPWTFCELGACCFVVAAFYILLQRVRKFLFVPWPPPPLPSRFSFFF